MLRQGRKFGPGGALLFCTILLFSLLFYSIPAQCQEIFRASKLINNGGYALLKNGKTLYAKNLNTPFIPASTLKLVTSLAALKILGPDHRFTTRLFLDNSNNLYIRGEGDPFLVSEKISIIAQQLARQGLTEIQDIILDDSAFALEHKQTDGSTGSTNPYDANNTALGVNFNSLPIQVLRRAKVYSPESQTPFLPIMGQLGKNLGSGYHRVNVDGFPQIGQLSNSLLYTGQLFTALLRREGIQVRGTIRQGAVASNCRLLLEYIAEEDIAKLVESLLLSSNNFMANQLFLAIGAAQFGYPATWKKGKKAMDAYIKKSLHLSSQEICMVEGSGLSTKNRITPGTMLTILKEFIPHTSLIPIKYGVRMKSGTLRKSGVYCYAGYIDNGPQQSPFVILLNQKKNGRDKILKQLYRTVIHTLRPHATQ